MSLHPTHQLSIIQCRSLISELCRRVRHGRAWFYRALKGDTKLTEAEQLILTNLVATSTPRSPIALLRESTAPMTTQATLARLAAVKRQTVSLWEADLNPPTDRLHKVRSLLRISA